MYQYICTVGGRAAELLGEGHATSSGRGLKGERGRPVSAACTVPGARLASQPNCQHQLTGSTVGI
jgi:hypothetical protein